MTSYLDQKSHQRSPGAGRLPTGKPGAVLRQDPCPALLAPASEPAERLDAVTSPVSVGGKASPEALTHELVEALTAIGNYLTAAIRVLTVEPRPPRDTLGEALEKSLNQFARAVETVRRLRAATCPENPCENNNL